MEIAKILDLSPKAPREAVAITSEDQQQLQHQKEEQQQQQQQQQQRLQFEHHQRLLIQKELSELSNSLQLVQRELELTAKSCDEQTQKIDTYNREMDALQQERLVHVQQLRSLHADINSLEGSLKRTEQSRQRELSRARGLMDRYGGLLTRVNRLRLLCNLEPMEDCSQLEWGPERSAVKQLPIPALPLSQLLQTAPQPLDFCGAAAVRQQSQYLAATSVFAPAFLPQFLAPQSLLPPATAFQPLPLSRPLSCGSQFQHQYRSHNQRHQRGTEYTAASSATQQTGKEQQHLQQTACHQQAAAIQVAPAAAAAASFHQQQPPPMKACLSCHEQIHRNAPICPLCKAKSRSKHPKKQKRKADE